MEFVPAIAILALTAALATETIRFPYMMMSSHAATIILVIAALGAFSVAPAVGLALFLLTAVLFFKRNVHRTVTSAHSKYGETTIPQQPPVHADPYVSQHSGPRNYNEFQETNPANPMLGAKIEGFEPAPYGAEQGSPVDGMFPAMDPRASASPEVEEYIYRPDADSGSNEFTRYGPDMDEKKQAFAYST